MSLRRKPSYGRSPLPLRGRRPPASHVPGPVPAVFGDGHAFDFAKIKAHFSARRVYYYDCLGTERREGEDDARHQERVANERAEIAAIEASPGVHVRLGHLSTGRKRTQKEVDVRLAVDMLTHAFHENMTRAFLLAGDRDFKPVVEAVVQSGVYVILAFDPRITSDDLRKAADEELPIDLTFLCQWMRVEEDSDPSRHFPMTHGIHQRDKDPVGEYSPRPCRMAAASTKAGQALALWQARPGEPEMYQVSVQEGKQRYRVHQFHNRGRLLAFVEKMYGPVEWTAVG